MLVMSGGIVSADTCVDTTMQKRALVCADTVRYALRMYLRVCITCKSAGPMSRFCCGDTLSVSDVYLNRILQSGHSHDAIELEKCITIVSRPPECGRLSSTTGLSHVFIKMRKSFVSKINESLFGFSQSVFLGSRCAYHQS